MAQAMIDAWAEWFDGLAAGLRSKDVPREGVRLEGTELGPDPFHQAPAIDADPFVLPAWIEEDDDE